MKRGVVFTLDALVSVVIAVMTLAIVTQLLSLRTGEWYKEIALYNTGEDFLTSAEKDGTFATAFNMGNADAITNLTANMSSQLPMNMVGRLNITICKYTAPNFICSRNFTAGQSGNLQTKSVVRRMLANSSSGNYSLIVMEVWYK